MNRRKFLKTIGTAALAAVLPLNSLEKAFANQEINIHIVMDDLGSKNDLPHVEAFKKYKGGAPITIATMPGEPYTKKSLEYISKEYPNCDILLHQPMQAQDKSIKIEAAPNTEGIYSNTSNTKVKNIVKNNIKSIKEIIDPIGINNHMGSLSTENRKIMRKVGEALDDGLFYLDSKTTPKSVACDEIRKLGKTCYERDGFLDHSGSVKKNIQKLEEKAIKSEDNNAIWIGHIGRPKTVKALLDYFNSFEKQGNDLVKHKKGKTLRIKLFSN